LASGLAPGSGRSVSFAGPRDSRGRDSDCMSDGSV
jgi:hypothetical protein